MHKEVRSGCRKSSRTIRTHPSVAHLSGDPSHLAQPASPTPDPPTLARANDCKRSAGPTVGRKDMKKKKNFTEREVDVLITEIEHRHKTLFGGLSSGISNARKAQEWQRVLRAVNAVGSQARTVPEIKKKWADTKLDVKKRVVAHRRSISATGIGPATPSLSPRAERVSAIIGEDTLSDVVPVCVGDSELIAMVDDKGEEAGPSWRHARGAADSGQQQQPPAVDPWASADEGHARVLTAAVLETQTATMDALNTMNGHLSNIAQQMVINNGHLGTLAHGMNLLVEVVNTLLQK